MKYVMIVMCLICLLVSGCFEKNSAWMMGNPESQGMAGVRIGTEVTKNLEVGASVNYMPSDSKTTTKTYQWCRWKKTVTTVEKEAQDSWQYGAYSILHFPMNGISPYIGAQANIGEGSDDIIDTLEPIGGVNLKMSENFSIFSEFQLLKRQEPVRWPCLQVESSMKVNKSG